MKLGIVCPSEIAFRRFMPALQRVREFEFIGLGVNSAYERFGHNGIENELEKVVIDDERNKAQYFINEYRGKIFNSYVELITSDDVEAVYIPLPPALHYKYARLALEKGKHILVEKPCTTNYMDSVSLVRLAKEKGLALHENYMFDFHSQLDEIERIIKAGEIGDIRLYRISFGFPMRADNDFRYNKALGGGALIDAGGYTIKYASRLLGSSTKVKCAQLNYMDKYEVDMYGSATLINDEGTTAQVSFGMDNNYKCELEVWGSKGCLNTGRILTAPVGFVPIVTIRNGNEDSHRELSSDDAFKKSIEYFWSCICDAKKRKESYESILRQAFLVEQFRKLAEL